MKMKRNSTRLTLWCSRGVAAVIVVLVFLFPVLLKWYSGIRTLTDLEQTVVGAAFYCCVPVVLAALWKIDRLLVEILGGQVFVRENVRRIRTIQLCCGLVSLICLPAAFGYAPLVFLVIIMAFLCLVVGVVAGVMDAAVAIREENDLTV